MELTQDHVQWWALGLAVLNILTAMCGGTKENQEKPKPGRLEFELGTS
jgi:hypothetical protein